MCQLLAEFEPPLVIKTALKDEFGVSIATEAIYHYKRSPKWQKVVQAKREALDAAIDRLPISSRYWRLKRRQEMIDKAEALIQKSSDVAAPGTLLQDAAKELGQLQPEAPTTRIGHVTLQLIQQVLMLPSAVVDEYLKTGNLPASSYLTDVPSEATQAKGGSDVDEEPAGRTPPADGTGSL